jgi:uncharacterized coiled-coil DUF342 family protein
MNNPQNPEQAQEHADQLQSEINDHMQKAESSSGEEKQMHVNKAQELKQRKDGLMNQINSWKNKASDMKDKGKNIFNKLGM